MGVVNDGHRDGDGGSYADAAFEGSWRGAGPGRASIGPLAEWDGRDPVVKTARVLGGDNNFESTAGPGADRVVQGADPNAAKGGVEHGVDAAKSPAPETRRQARASGSPDTGAKGPDHEAGAGKATSDMAPDKGRPTGPKSYLTQSGAAPVPGALIPAPVSPVWTGSGPNAAMVVNSQKMAAAEDGDDLDPGDDEIDAALFFAGVPPRLAPGAWLRSTVGESLTKVAADEAETLALGDVHPMKLAALLDDYFGSQWHDWDPEVISKSLASEAGVEPADSVMNKIMAVKIAMRRPDVFYDRWQAFEKIAVSLNNHDPSMAEVEELDPDEMANAVTIFAKLAGPGDFSADVTAYVAAKLYDSGFVVAPPQLSFADQRLGAMVKNDDLRGKVILAYARAVKSDDPLPDSEDPVAIQVARLVRTHVYVLDQLAGGGRS